MTVFVCPNDPARKLNGCGTVWTTVPGNRKPVKPKGLTQRYCPDCSGETNGRK